MTTPLALGRCPHCGTGIALEDGATTAGWQATCPACFATVVLHAVRGVYAEHTPCDDRCMSALGPSCSCSCGGDNHGRGYIAPLAMRPEWLTERDARRHAALLERRAAAARASREKVATAQACLLIAWPALAWLTYLEDADMHDGSEFLDDMLTAFEAGKMTDRQAQAAVRAINRETQRRDARAARDARDTALLASGWTYPTGRATVTGTVASVRDSVNSYTGHTGHTDWKVLVEAEEGYRVWMTLPRPLITWAMDEQQREVLAGNDWRPWGAVLRGRRVRFVATLQPKGDSDPLFGFASRPTKAQVLEEVPA